MLWVSPGGTLRLVSTIALYICCLSRPTRLSFPDPPQHLLLLQVSWRLGSSEEVRAALSSSCHRGTQLPLHIAVPWPGQALHRQRWSLPCRGRLMGRHMLQLAWCYLTSLHTSSVFFQHVWTHLITQTIFQALLGFSMESWMGCDGSGQSPRHLVSQHQGVQHSMASLRTNLLLCHIHTPHIKDKFIWGGSRSCFRPAKAAGWALWTHHFVVLKQMHILPLLSLLQTENDLYKQG